MLGIEMLPYKKCSKCNPTFPTVRRMRFYFNKKRFVDYDDVDLCMECKYVEVNDKPIQQLEPEKKLRMIKRLIDRDVEYLMIGGVFKGLLS